MMSCNGCVCMVHVDSLCVVLNKRQVCIVFMWDTVV